MAGKTILKDAKAFRRDAILLAALFALALVLRMVFNVGVAHDPLTDSYLYSGNDPWYHDRTVETMVYGDDHSTVGFDPAINYPEGGNNPNPPLYGWVSSVVVKTLDLFGVEPAVSYGLNFSVAMWGALTVIPVFLFARQLWGSAAGFFAGTFLAFSAPHIERSAFGFADHDATTVFWIALSFYFMLRSLQVVKAGVKATGMEEFQKQRPAVIYAALAGVSLAAMALTWKGYPYAIGILAIAYSLHFLNANLRHKDGSFVGYLFLIAAALPLIISAPYYLSSGFYAGTILPNLYALIGMVAVFAVLHGTRHLPNVVVVPAILLTAILGFVTIKWIFPSIGELIFSGLGYFNQSKLYSTIAEAQRTPLGYVAASFGFFTFILAFWGFGRAIKNAWKLDPVYTFVVAWAIVAGFMTFAASRFIVNAAPLFAVLMAGPTAWLLAKADFASVRRRIRQNHGENSFKGFMRSLSARSIGTVLGVAFLLVLPNVWFGVDAATSYEYEAKHGLNDSHFFGAYGLSFGVDSNGWLEAFHALAQEDQDLAMADRPAFLAWWDYGHWATSIGKHPTVADPFQNHHEIVGRFLASETEDESFMWLNVLLIDGALKTGSFNTVSGIIDSQGGDSSMFKGNYDDKAMALENVSDNYELYGHISEATGKSIGYLGVDFRMYPVNGGGIFYAPVFLANKNPDDFLRTTVSGSGISLTLQQYDFDADGNSYRLDTPRFVDSAGNNWFVAGGMAYRSENDALNNPNSGIAIQSNFQPTVRFFNSMYNKAYGGTSLTQPAGQGLSHWKVLTQSIEGESRLVVILKMVDGADLTGTVQDNQGAAMANAVVRVKDEFGAVHDQQATDASGNYKVNAIEGDLSIEVVSGGQVLATRALSVAEKPQPVSGFDFQIARGSVSGIAYVDVNGDGAYNAGNDTLVSGASVTIDSITVTSGADGTYSLPGIQAGSRQSAIAKDGFVPRTVTVSVPTGANVVSNVALTAAA